MAKKNKDKDDNLATQMLEAIKNEDRKKAVKVAKKMGKKNKK